MRQRPASLNASIKMCFQNSILHYFRSVTQCPNPLKENVGGGGFECLQYGVSDRVQFSL